MTTFCPLKLLGLIFVTLIITFSWKLLQKTLFKLSIFLDTWQFTSFSAPHLQNIILLLESSRKGECFYFLSGKVSRGVD